MSDPLPKLPNGSVRRPPAGRYREQYGIILVCEDEATQARIYDGLRLLGGCRIKVVST